MPPRNWRLRIDDILEAIAPSSGIPRECRRRSQRRRPDIDAVIRNFEIIAEAAGAIDPELRDRHPEIPWREMRGMRNIVAHAYLGVSIPIVWQTLTADLPPVVPLLRTLVDTESGSSG